MRLQVKEAAIDCGSTAKLHGKKMSASHSMNVICSISQLRPKAARGVLFCRLAEHMAQHTVLDKSK